MSKNRWQRLIHGPTPEEDEVAAQQSLLEKERAARAGKVTRPLTPLGETKETQRGGDMPLIEPNHGDSSQVGAEGIPERHAYMVRRALPFLPHGTVVRQIFGAQLSIPVPILLINVILTPLFGWRMVAVTDEAIYVLEARYWLLWRPTRLRCSLPRSTYFGSVSGFWGRIQLGSRTAWVNWRYFDAVRAADREYQRRYFGT